ncbi:MAG: MBL fold metallo-hydrolase [Bacteroidia bacterium]|nr:MBL fold metallo-hydrolase [Bacteroidia bacterium]
MSLFISSLNSGSNGNCYYIGNQDEAVLIDGGISCRETEMRMKRIGLPMKRVRAIFVSHEHSDHISGVTRLSKKYRLPVYITKSTLQNGNLMLGEDLALGFRAYEPIRIGNLSVTAFPKFHDAIDPHSFIIESDTVKVGVFTDIGQTCEHLIKHFKQCNAVFLESNYDEEMLETGKYPWSLKNRIRGGRGHLSNAQALQLFMEHKSAQLTHLFLSHLSKHNNSPKLVKDLFKKMADGTEIIIAPRNKETQLYHIRNIEVNRLQRTKSQRSQLQLTLFQ